MEHVTATLDPPKSKKEKRDMIRDGLQNALLALGRRELDLKKEPVAGAKAKERVAMPEAPKQTEEKPSAGEAEGVLDDAPHINLNDAQGDQKKGQAKVDEQQSSFDWEHYTGP